MRKARLLGVAMAGAMGLLPVVPPAHLHAGEEDGHHHVVVHQHLQPHEVLERFGHSRAAFDDDDGPILTLTAAYTVTSPALVSPPARVVVALLEPPATERYDRPIDDVEILIHGPPRAPTPARAPPFFPAL